MEIAYGGLFALLAAVWGFAIIIGIVFYIFLSLGLYKLAQNQGMPNAWLAWIPVAQFYIVGKIVGEAKFGDAFTIPRLDLVLPLGTLALLILSWIPVVGQLAALAFAVVSIYSLYLLYKKYVPEQAVLYTVLSCILGLVWLFVFLIRDKEQVA